MRRLIPLLAIVALLAAGCDSGSDESDDETSGTTTAAVTTTDGSTSGKTFTKADLPKLALPAASAPQGLKLSKVDSGAKSLEDIGIILDTQLREMRALGFVALHDAIFDSTRQETSDLRVAERVWLFENAQGASNWLERTRENSFAAGLGAIRSETLAEGSWAGGGQLGTSSVITHAFRVGNVVVVVSSLSDRGNVSQQDALAAAKAAEKRING